MNDIFQIVKKYKRNKFSKPVILMGYYNMIYQYGENNFLNKCKKNRSRWTYSCRSSLARKQSFC